MAAVAAASAAVPPSIIGGAGPGLSRIVSGATQRQQQRPPVTSLQSFRDRAGDLLGHFDAYCIRSKDKDRTLSASIKRRMEMVQQMHSLMGEYSADARQMLLDGATLDFDLPLHMLGQMEQLMNRVAKESSERMAPTLQEVAGRAAKTLQETKNKTPEQRLGIAKEILGQIHGVHMELKRLIAEFGAFFQPLATVPAGFFAVPKVNVQAAFLKSVAGQWTMVTDQIKKSIFAAVDVERSVYHQADAASNPQCVELRNAISDAITFWVRIQKDGEGLLKSKFIPDYLNAAESALARIGSKMTVRQLLDVVVSRIANEQDRFRQLFNGADPTPVRRVVQVGLVKLQVARIQKDGEVGLDAALVYPTRQDLFPKLVLMLDFDETCIKTICDAITSNVSAALGFLVERENSARNQQQQQPGPQPAGAAAAAAEVSEDDKGSDTIAIISDVYEQYRSVISLCSPTATEQHLLRFFVALRAGINAGLPHAGMETVLAAHFHRLLKDSGSCSAADVQFRAYDVRSACASFGPLLKDVNVFVRVYQHRLGSRLMSRKAPNVKLEQFAVDELTASIGTAHTHAMRAMVSHYASSAAAASAATPKKASAAVAPPGGKVVALSRYAWPAFSMVSSATVTLHPAIAEITQKDREEWKLTQAKLPGSAQTPLKADVHPLLSNVELKTGSGAGIFGNAVQCSLLLHIGEAQGGLRANEAAELMKITEREAAWIIGTLLRSGVVAQDSATGKYSVTKLPVDKRVVLSSVWGVASRKAARAAGAKDSATSGDDEASGSSCVVQ